MTFRQGASAPLRTLTWAALFALLGPQLALAQPTYDAGFARWLERAQPRKNVESLPPQVAPAVGKDGASRVGVHLSGRLSPAELEARGIAVGTRIQDDEGIWHLTARLPLADLPRLLELEGLERLEAARRTRPALDMSAVEAGVSTVHGAQGAPPAYAGLSGAGVVVGIVDTGLDYRHEDFLDSQGNPRVAWLWDQTDDAPAPGAPAAFGYGTEWNAGNLTAGLARQQDLAGHGSHVAGIAAGSGRATDHGKLPYRFVGLAPRATLVAVKTDFSTTGVLDAVDYVFRKAQDLGMPAVVNLSLGSQAGPHDGTGSFARGVDALVGVGRIVVASAGNEGSGRIHAEVDAAGVNNRFTVRLADYLPQSGGQNDVVLLSAQVPDAGVLVRVITPAGTSIGPVAVGTITSNPTAEGTLFVDNGSGGVGRNGHREVEIQIFDGAGSGDPAPGVWTFEFTAAGVPSAEVDAWIYQDSLGGSGAARVEIGLDGGEVVGTPAVADEVIAVGSYVTRATWTGLDGGSYGYNPSVEVGAVSPFTSIGPRRDGMIKPDLGAPGQGIFSTLSADVRRSAATDSRIEADERHMLSQGTSQAAPHVAGAVALLLERFPQMVPAQARSVLTGSAREDAYTGNVPNPVWGYGKLDVPGALALAEQTSVALSSFTADSQDDGVDVRWVLETVGPATGLRLERQEGNGPFSVVGTFPAVEGESRVLDRGNVEIERRYRLLATALDQADMWLGEVLVLAVEVLPEIPVLRQNSPNPFNPRTKIPFFLPAAGPVDLAVFDLRGRRLRTLLREDKEPGEHEVEFDGLDELGLPLPSGTYLVRLEAAGDQTGQMITLTK